jgi:hypothetical protein
MLIDAAEGGPSAPRTPGRDATSWNRGPGGELP